MKACRKCHQLKTVDEFHRRSSSHDGRDFYCKVCRNEMVRRHRPNHGTGVPRSSWTCNVARELALERQRAERQRQEDEQRDLEVAAILRSHREEAAR